MFVALTGIHFAYLLHFSGTVVVITVDVSSSPDMNAVPFRKAKLS